MGSLKKAVKQEVLFLQRVFVHFGLRGAYFFAKNSWGMLVHPWLTTARVWGNKNYTQMFLVFGFPFNLWLLIAFFGIFIWLGFRPEGVWWHWFGRLFGLLTLFLIVLAGYYAFWIWRYRQLKKQKLVSGKIRK